MSYKEEAPALRLLPGADEKDNFTDVLKKAIPGCLAAAGAVFAAKSALPSVPGEGWVYALSAALITLAVMLLSNTRIGKAGYAAGMALPLILFLVRFRGSAGGAAVLGNDVLSFLNGRTGRFHMPFDEGGAGSFDAAWIFVILLILISVLCAFSAEKRSVILPLTLLAAVIVFTAQGLVNSFAGILLTGAAALITFFIRGADGRSGAGTAGRAAASVTLLAAAVLSVLLAAGIVRAFWPGNGATINDSIAKARHDSKYHTGDTVLPEGSLSDLGPRINTEEAALSVTMDEPRKTYLRGHVYEVYTGTGWKEAPERTLSDNADIFYWLHRKGFYAPQMIGKAAELTETGEKKTMSVRVLDACSEVSYLPYSVYDEHALDPMLIGDGRNAAADTDTFEYYPGSIVDWYELQSAYAAAPVNDDIKACRDMEASYKEYVESNDLQLTNAVLGVLGRTIDDDGDERTLSQIFGIIRNTLDETLTYNEGVSTYSGKNDFLQYVMEQSRMGYDVHYATAAVLMFRYMGVPARYVEGYYISPEEAEMMTPGEEYILDGSHAHAWAEYYLDGVGWMPFETTPGYDQTEEAEVARKGEGLEGSMGNSSYARNSQRYEPPEDEPPEDETDRDEKFRFTTALLLKLLLILLIILLLILLIRIISRYIRYRNAMKDMEGSGNREAIIKAYAYSSMLLGLTGVPAPENDPEIKNINLEALYSTHEMDDEKRRRAFEHMDSVKKDSYKSMGFGGKIRHHILDHII